MIPFFDSIRDFSVLSAILRLALCCLSAGIIGIDRGRKGRAAGLRTHILVSLGACIVMITDQYLVTYMNPNADPARLGAQVISGIGFLGAGTILITGRQVTGLTTAAGLWSTACIGLAYGAGYFEGGIVATVIVLVTIAMLHKWESRGSSNIFTWIDLMIELEKTEDLPALISGMKACGAHIRNVDINDNPRRASRPGVIQVQLSIKVEKSFSMADLAAYLTERMPIVAFKEL